MITEKFKDEFYNRFNKEPKVTLEEASKFYKNSPKISSKAWEEFMKSTEEKCK